MGGAALSLAIKNGVLLAIVIVIAHLVARNYRRSGGVNTGGRRPAAKEPSPSDAPFGGGAPLGRPASARPPDPPLDQDVLLDYVFGPGGTAENFAVAAVAATATAAASPASAAAAAAAAPKPAHSSAAAAPSSGGAAGAGTSMYAAYGGGEETFLGSQLGELRGFDKAEQLFSAPLA